MVLSKSGLVVAIVLTGLFASGGVAETIQLKNGSMIRGELLSKSDQRVVVDLGFTVLSVPRDEIEKITADKADGAKDETARAKGELWSTAKKRAEMAVKRNVTRCGEAVIARENPSLHRALLVKNSTLKHGFFAIGADGGIELVGTQLADTCDVEEFTTLLANIAVVGDYLEQQLADGLPGGDLDLY